MYAAKTSQPRSMVKSPNNCFRMQRPSPVGRERASRLARLRPVSAMENFDWTAPALEIAKLAGPTVTLVLFGLNQNRQMGRMEARQEALEKALTKQETTSEKGFARQEAALKEAITLLRNDIKDGQDKQEAANASLQKGLDDLKSDLTYLKGFKAGEAEKSRIFLR